MNILFTSDLSGMGGGETSLLNLCSCLKKKHNITVVCAKEGKLVRKLKELNIDVYVINYRDKKLLVHNCLVIRKILKERRIEVIHSNDPLTSILFWGIGLGLQLDNYWTCHGQWYQFNLLIKNLIKISNKHIFCVSTKVKDNLELQGIKKCSVTYLGIPLQMYKSASNKDIRKELNINTDKFVVAVVGRYQKIKGQLKAVQAIRFLVDKEFDVKCLLIGGCIFDNAEDENYMKQVQKYIEKNKLGTNVMMLGERDDVQDILKQVDVLLIPSDNESFGMVAIEAMASGLGVISTPCDGVAEILENNMEMVATKNNAISLSVLLEQYMTQKEVRDSIHDYINIRMNDFDIELIAEKYNKIFEGEIV